MRRVRILLATAVAAAGLSTAVPSGPASAHSPGCHPHDSGDDIKDWDPVCRDFVVDPGKGNLVSRAVLLQHQTLYTEKAMFTPNFLWYSDETQVTIKKTEIPANNTRWTGCNVVPGEGNECPRDKIAADFYGVPHPVDRGPVLRAFGWASEITLSVFSYGGVWIAKGCGNWLDVNERPKPVPRLEGYKFRDDNRDGNQDSGEPMLSGWSFRVSRLSSTVGQSLGELGVVSTDASGRYDFALDGHGPGEYRVEEIAQTGWASYTPAAYNINVEFGGGDHKYRHDFGNAQTTADVAKISMAIVSAPPNFVANVPSDVTVEVTVQNNGPSEQVPVQDDLDIVLLNTDCVSLPSRRSFVTTLRRGVRVTRSLTYSVTCSRPSNHSFRFDDDLRITRGDISDPNPSNNKKSIGLDRAVHAKTNFGVSAAVTCGPRTNVGVPVACTGTFVVSNSLFPEVGADVDVRHTVPSDCVASEPKRRLVTDPLEPGGSLTLTTPFTVTCSHRSFHDVTTHATVKPSDPHVFDDNSTDDQATSIADTVEVFHDASMAVVDLHLTCNESVGVSTFTCTTDLKYQKTGPAPEVLSTVWAEIDGLGACTTVPSNRQFSEVTLNDALVRTARFTWLMNCPPGSTTLHPFTASADVNPILDRGDPHPADVPKIVVDHWSVPTCLPTVNPKGQKQPQAPGNGVQGQNQDGFYQFAMLPGYAGELVRIRDTGSSAVFGPFANGTRIKWVEANGATPTIAPMAGNNGSGANATAVDFEIRARGDAKAFFVDEKGVEVSVTCLVPPFPK